MGTPAATMTPSRDLARAAECPIQCNRRLTQNGAGILRQVRDCDRSIGTKSAPWTTTMVPFGPDEGVVVSEGPSSAGVTTRAAVPERVAEGSEAVMVAAPVETPVARPWEPEALEMVAEDEDDDQVTESVRLAVLVSE